MQKKRYASTIKKHPKYKSSKLWKYNGIIFVHYLGLHFDPKWWQWWNIDQGDDDDDDVDMNDIKMIDERDDEVD